MQRWRTRPPGPQHKIPSYVPDNPAATGDLLGGGGIGDITGGNTGFAGGININAGFGQTPPEAHLDTTPQPGQPGAYRGSLSGFDNTKLNNGHDTIKYKAAHVFENFAPSQENMPAVLQALKAAGLNVDQVGKDSFDFHDGYGPVDAGIAFGTNDPNQMKWGWQVKNQQHPQSGANPALLSAIGGAQQPQANDPQQAFYQQLLQQFMQQVQQ